MSWSKPNPPKQPRPIFIEAPSGESLEDWDSIIQESSPSRQVNATLPGWLVDELDAEAARRSISRKAVINSWLVDRADAEIDRRVQLSHNAVIA